MALKLRVTVADYGLTDDCLCPDVPLTPLQVEGLKAMALYQDQAYTALAAHLAAWLDTLESRVEAHDGQIEALSDDQAATITALLEENEDLRARLYVHERKAPSHDA